MLKRAAYQASTDGRRVYAIGDIHGRLDLLKLMVAAIAEDIAADPPRQPATHVFLGDYIDRGPDSRGVVDYAHRLMQTLGPNGVALMGNHEHAMLKFIEKPHAGPSWVSHGGLETLVSYGVRPPALRSDYDGWDETRQALVAAIPPAHLEFLRSLQLTHVVGDYLFVHAGVRPNVRLQDQDELDLLRIRREFIAHNGSHEYIVVHGHTPTDEPFVGNHRIGLDTGAYATGVLTAIRLYEGERKLITVRDPRLYR